MSKLDNSSQKATIKCIVPEEKSGIASKQLVQMKERGEHYVTLCNMEPGCFVNWTCSVLFCNIIIFISRHWTLGQISFDCGEAGDVYATGDSVTFAKVAQMIYFRNWPGGILLVILNKTLEGKIFVLMLDIYFRLPNWQGPALYGRQYIFNL